MATTTPQEATTTAYRNRVLGFLGDQDPLQVLGRTADVLAEIVRDHGRKRMQIRPIEGKWTPCEVLGHLCDCEWVYGYRARLILCEDNPPILGMDQDLWVAGQRYNEREPIELAEEFRYLRKHNLRMWRGLTPQELERTGQHNERGRESLGLVRTLLAGHDLLHLDQMKRLLMAIV
jgi:DinB superfamily